MEFSWNTFVHYTMSDMNVLGICIIIGNCCIPKIFDQFIHSSLAVRLVNSSKSFLKDSQLSDIIDKSECCILFVSIQIGQYGQCL